MKRLIFLLITLCSIQPSFAFCGFYVAQADAKLFNKTSEVIIARMGDQTVVTMSSDFEGPVQDFAMVIPIPEVPTRAMIRVADPNIFGKLDAYSGPRIVEYFDSDPCEANYEDDWGGFDDFDSGFESEEADSEEETDEKNQVTIKARYTVGEYDIIILSAKESGGLVRWLTANEYKIPEKAKRLLQPYIKNGMFFFLVKVNLDKMPAGEKQDLRPLQLTYASDRFMLPIRLGMANAEENQDMIVYAFSDRGRIECTNYRTVEIPTDVRVPEFAADTFGAFYNDLFNKSWKDAGENVVFTEYSWNLDADNYTKCDPCATTPPNYAELREAGVFWLDTHPKEGWRGCDYDGELHFTRMHVRYRTETFPQDLMFQDTPDKDPFQGRYVVHRVADSYFECKVGQQYLQALIGTRKAELKTMEKLTGWNPHDFEGYAYAYSSFMKKAPWLEKKKEDEKRNFWFVWVGDFFKNAPVILWILLGLTLFLLLFRQKKRSFPYPFAEN